MSTPFKDFLLNIAYQQVDDGKPIAATDAIVQQLDTWLSEDKLDHVRSVLTELDPRYFPPEVLTGVLSITWHAKERLGTTRTIFFIRVMAALETVWELSAEDLKKIAARLQ